MPWHSHIANKYGFPPLDRAGDSFDEWVAAAGRYVAANSTMSTTGVEVYADSSEWATSSTYRYQDCAISDEGLVVFAPGGEPHFATLDTVANTLSVFDHPTYTMSSSTYWGSNTFQRFGTVTWAPSNGKFYYGPSYYYRYLVWDPIADSYYDWLRSGSTALQLVHQSRYYDGKIYHHRGGTNWSVIDTSDDSMTNPTVSSLALNGFANGPDGKALCASRTTLSWLNFSTMTAELIVSSSGLFGTGTQAVTRPVLAADGSFWIFPGDAGTTTGQTYLIVRFDPADESYEQFNMLAAPYGKQPSSNISYRNPTLMPDGRIFLPSIYAPSAQGYGPHIWDPVAAEWVAINWGSYPVQWGLHWSACVAADGRLIATPQRITSRTVNGVVQYEAGISFSSAPTEPPPPEFFASPYKS